MLLEQEVTAWGEWTGLAETESRSCEILSL